MHHLFNEKTDLYFSNSFFAWNRSLYAQRYLNLSVDNDLFWKGPLLLKWNFY